jgi:hypothetical protein
MKFPDGAMLAGSGAIIGHPTNGHGYHVLTAGHCVYSHSHGGWATKVTVIPGLDDDYMPFYLAYVTKMRSYIGWTEYQMHQHDWALLTLDRTIGDITGWMGRMTAPFYNSIYTDTLNTAGYPGDLGPNTMWFDSDYGRIATEYNHWYYMDTYFGQSGSPVWRFVDPDRWILSINAYNDDGSGSNHGTRLDQDKFDDINQWCSEDKVHFKAFLIDDGQSYSGFYPKIVKPGVTIFNVWCGVRNIGTASSDGFYVSYYASTDTIISQDDYLLGSDYIESITPFSWDDSKLSKTFPKNIPDGTYWIGWIIDTNDFDVKESYENNKIAYKSSYQLTVETKDQSRVIDFFNIFTNTIFQGLKTILYKNILC